MFTDHFRNPYFLLRFKLFSFANGTLKVPPIFVIGIFAALVIIQCNTDSTSSPGFHSGITNSPGHRSGATNSTSIRPDFTPVNATTSSSILPDFTPDSPTSDFALILD
ncbi:hypothetical protein DdX_14273 [Ditylenchus destructor]|uniref:Uncharacterized protein n=1 Tax=Ditylenchus destructor TaxID=166010 RepID=A0AAD4MUI9_9BILA|nr:hypothetical protein DdX_14273 [Ditylenchus destructor]